MNEKLVGAWGEAMAAEYLRKRGYKILSMGFRTRFGEIDLIAANRRYVAFVEVKTRKNADFAAAREAVAGQKRERINRARPRPTRKFCIWRMPFNEHTPV